MRLKDHIGKLEYFCAVAESRSIKGASKKVFIGQPQLTKVVKQLEDCVGTKLVVRSSKGITLTQPGEKLYRYSKKILQQIDEAEFLIKSKDENFQGELRIGTYDSIARYFFPDFIKYINATMPGVSLRLHTGRSEEILKKLKNKEFDVVIIVAEAKSTNIVSASKIYSDSFGLYKSVNMENRFDKNLIYFPYPLNNTPEAMKRFGFVHSMVCDNLETVRSLAEQGVGIGLLPHRVAKQSVMNSQLVEHDHPRIKSNSFDTHDISMFHLKKEESSLKNFVVDEMKRFLSLWHKA